MKEGKELNKQKVQNKMVETNTQKGEKCYKRTQAAIRKYNKRPKLNFGGN